MAEAPMYHGVALVGYVDGKPVDAFGNEVKGAPAQPKDTDPSEQPHVMAAMNTEERSAAILAGAFAAAMGKGSAVGATKVSSSTAEEAVEPPTLAELPDHLAGLTTVADVKALQKGDKRVGAQKLYEARIAELEGE